MKENFSFSSIQKYYEFFKKEKIDFTVPAINIRTLTKDVAKTLFRAAKKERVKFFIIEIARSEINYTKQTPREYFLNIKKAAKEENFQGEIFLQGDHFQINKEDYFNNKKNKKEITFLKNLILDAIKNKFYQIDLDFSPLKDEKENAFLTCEFLNFIRKKEPKNIKIALGAEVGEIGDKNTTKEQLKNFLNYYQKFLFEKKILPEYGIIKLAVQIGTKHGGFVDKFGKLHNPKIDFKLLNSLSKIIKENNLAGLSFHGASTLSEKILQKLPEYNVLEVHLATQFQNIILDSKYFPSTLKEKMYQWLKENFQKKEEESEMQFYYRVRKYALGKFKKEISNISQKNIDKICEELEEKFISLFRVLKVSNTI